MVVDSITTSQRTKKKQRSNETENKFKDRNKYKIKEELNKVK